MEKNWLIRTYQKQILGPVSKEKLLEFFQKGSIGVSDEVSSGNGYWFYLKEKELVDRYLLGDVPQSFNPISEAKTVLALKAKHEMTASLNAAPANNKVSVQNTSDIVLPPTDDLEYPDITQVSAQMEDVPDITIIAHMPSLQVPVQAAKPVIKEVKKEANALNSEAPILPPSDDLEYPDMGEILAETTEEERDFKVDLPTRSTPNVVKPEKQELTDPGQTATLKLMTTNELKLDKNVLYERKTKVSNSPATKLPAQKTRTVAKELEKRNDNYLFLIFFVLVVILFGIFYYYREILNKPLPI